MSGETADPDAPVPVATWAIGVVFGVAAALSGAQPTGTADADAVLIIGAVTLVVVFASAGPWWSPTVAAGVGAAIALQPVGALIGAVGFVVGAFAGARPTDDSAAVRAAPAVTAGLALNSLIRSDMSPPAGLSAAVGIGIALGIASLGWRSRSAAMQRLVLGLGLTAVAVAVVATAAVAIVGWSARSQLSTATVTSQGAVAALDDGEYALAGSLFETSAMNFEAVDDRLSSVWTLPSRVVPVLAQNVRAGSSLAAAAAATSRVAGTALATIDPSTLRVTGGAIDIDAIRAVEPPLAQVQTAFVDLDDTLREVDSPWLIAPLQSELDEVDEKFVEQRPRLDNVVEAVRLLPELLGERSPRTYLVLFTTPAEARGLGGFAGSYTTVEIDDGVLDVRDVGRIEDLNRATRGADCSACADELLDRYGRYGLTTGPLGSTGDATWSNLPMSAHFPYVADAAVRLFPQATDDAIDGVIVMDPYVVEQFVRYGGPIEVPAFDRVVQPDEVADFILRDQYLLADARDLRLDALDALGAGALSSVLAGELPEPAVILGDLAELVAERRLLMWTDRPDEQALFDSIGLIGALPAIDPSAGGFSVAVTNASGSKIDVFLDRQTSVDVVVEDGRRILRAEVSLTNDAPVDGLPAYVIGNRIGLPVGSSRLFVTFYGPPGLVSSTLDGEALSLEQLPEAGWIAYGHFVTFDPGQQHRYVLEFELPEDGPGATEPTVWVQPLADRET